MVLRAKRDASSHCRARKACTAQAVDIGKPFSTNFTLTQLVEGIQYLHAISGGKTVYGATGARKTTPCPVKSSVVPISRGQPDDTEKADSAKIKTGLHPVTDCENFEQKGIAIHTFSSLLKLKCL